MKEGEIFRGLSASYVLWRSLIFGSVLIQNIVVRVVKLDAEFLPGKVSRASENLVSTQDTHLCILPLQVKS